MSKLLKYSPAQLQAIRDYIFEIIESLDGAGLVVTDFEQVEDNLDVEVSDLEEFLSEL